jgi:8-oxo-dGTP pyrophosphatase MutT (NUDIX family)
MSAAATRLVLARDLSSSRNLSPRQLRQLKRPEQVAAVCYRLTPRGIEFLLVRTRGGRWTFPKGSVEPGLTHAQAAALEAFEEAGVHGRIEEAAFAQYLRRKRRGKRDAKAFLVHAHLCEVTRLGAPQEAKRKPTWFSETKAKLRLGEDRSGDEGLALARVVDRAVARIERLCMAASAPPDALHKVQVEASPGAGNTGQVMQAWITQAMRRPRGDLRHSVELAVNAHLSKVLRFIPQAEGNGNAEPSPVQPRRRLPERCN